ncbi:hypothetical protein V5738_03300 [Salinisphaera sp. SPP-AMP-43]|uniref:hypothetical protein n=1 Tax=Salinisphaera sp. SPP-AMP-43 TaxID=3121288 RepID=UPI003C6E3AC0
MSTKPSSPGLNRTHAALGTGSLCVLATLLWGVLVINGMRHGLWSIVGLSAFGAVAFCVGAIVSLLPHHARILAYFDAAAAGAMLSAALLLVAPHAVIDHAETGLLGLLVGLGAGALLHRTGARNDGLSILTALSLHSLGAGIAVGALYTAMPTLSWAVGIAILGHKAPAGYVLTRRLQSVGQNRLFVVLPALGTGLGALSIAIMQPAIALPVGLIFGAAAGLFVYVALAFVAAGATTVGRGGAAEWAAFAMGGIVIAITGAVTPHGI